MIDMDKLKQYGEGRLKDYLTSGEEFTDAHYDVIRFFFKEYPDLREKYELEYEKLGVYVDEMELR